MPELAFGYVNSRRCCRWAILIYFAIFLQDIERVEKGQGMTLNDHEKEILAYMSENKISGLGFEYICKNSRPFITTRTTITPAPGQTGDFREEDAYHKSVIKKYASTKLDDHYEKKDCVKGGVVRFDTDLMEIKVMEEGEN